jgi:hypothetical protein
LRLSLLAVEVKGIDLPYREIVNRSIEDAEECCVIRIDPVEYLDMEVEWKVFGNSGELTDFCLLSGGLKVKVKCQRYLGGQWRMQRSLLCL